MKKPIVLLTLFIFLGLIAISSASADSGGAIFYNSGHRRLGFSHPKVGECAGLNEEFAVLDGFRRINPDGTTFLHVNDQSVELYVRIAGDDSEWSGDGKLNVNRVDGLGILSAKGVVKNSKTGQLAKAKCYGNMHDDVWFIKVK